MSPRAQRRGSVLPTLGALVDEAFEGGRLRGVAHPEDWPTPHDAPDLPGSIWDRAVGDVARDMLERPSLRFRALPPSIGSSPTGT